MTETTNTPEPRHWREHRTASEQIDYLLSPQAGEDLRAAMAEGREAQRQRQEQKQREEEFLAERRRAGSPPISEDRRRALARRRAERAERMGW